MKGTPAAIPRAALEEIPRETPREIFPGNLEKNCEGNSGRNTTRNPLKRLMRTLREAFVKTPRYPLGEIPQKKNETLESCEAVNA